MLLAGLVANIQARAGTRQTIGGSVEIREHRDASEVRLSTYRGNDEARTLGVALLRVAERGQRVPCDGLDPSTVHPSTCEACPLAVRIACSDYGRASGSRGTFGGERIGYRAPG